MAAKLIQPVLDWPEEGDVTCCVPEYRRTAAKVSGEARLLVPDLEDSGWDVLSVAAEEGTGTVEFVVCCAVQIVLRVVGDFMLGQSFTLAGAGPLLELPPSHGEAFLVNEGCSYTEGEFGPYQREWFLVLQPDSYEACHFFVTFTGYDYSYVGSLAHSLFLFVESITYASKTLAEGELDLTSSENSQIIPLL